jgi:hypothetical protein
MHSFIEIFWQTIPGEHLALVDDSHVITKGAFNSKRNGTANHM